MPGPLDQYILDRAKLSSLRRRKGYGDESDDPRQASIRRRTQSQAQPAPITTLNALAPSPDDTPEISRMRPPPSPMGRFAAALTAPPAGMNEIQAGTQVPALGSGQPSPREAPRWDSKYTGEMRLGGKLNTLEGVNPQLRAILEAATTRLPEGWRAEVTSGRAGGRENDPRFHGKGMAIDVQLVDPSGRRLPNYQSPENFRAYEQFAQAARAAQLAMHPDTPFRWGGYFWNGGPKNYGNMDLMHFDIGGVETGAGSWEHGLTPAARQAYGGAAQSVGLSGSNVPTFTEAALSPFRNQAGQAPRAGSGGWAPGQGAPTGGPMARPVGAPPLPPPRPDGSQGQPQVQGGPFPGGLADRQPTPADAPAAQGGPFPGGLADRQPGAPPVSSVAARGPAQQWSSSAANENVAMALQDAARRRAESGEPSPGIGLGGGGATPSGGVAPSSQASLIDYLLKPGDAIRSGVDTVAGRIKGWFA